MSPSEHAEAIERTLAELEAQQSAAQLALEEVLAELEVLYGELEERSQQLDVDAALEAAAAGEDASSPDADRLRQCEQELETTRRQRDELQQQLREALTAVEQLESQRDSLLAAADVAGAERFDLAEADVEECPLDLAAEPSPLRAPFQRLRAARAADGE